MRPDQTRFADHARQIAPKLSTLAPPTKRVITRVKNFKAIEPIKYKK